MSDFNFTPPAAGTPLSATWMRGLVAALRSMRLRVAEPLRLTRGPDGTTLSLRAQPGGGAAAAVPQAWDLTVDGNTARCARCLVMRSATTVMAPGDLSAGMSGSGGWLCGELDTEANTLALVWGDPPAALQEDSELVRFPLYRMKKDGNGPWSVECDARAIPRLGIHV